MAKILIVDDIPDNRELIATLVRYDGHEAIEAADGAEALELARATRPELVVCDILMPTMDGYEFVRRLRSEPDIADTRVVFYTANYHEREARALARSLGVTRIITKPSTPEAILEAVGAELELTAPAPPEVDDQAFSAEHLRVLTDKLAAKASELESANQRLAALTELNLQLAAEQDANAAMAHACRGARQLLGARYAIVCIQTRNNGTPGPTHWGSGFDNDPPESLRTGELFSNVMTQGLSIRRRTSADTFVLPESFPPVHCLMVTPISSALSVLGWVCLLNKVGGAEFTREDEWVANALATQAGHIFENRALSSRLEHRANDLSEEVRTRMSAEHQLRRALRARKVMAECNRTLVRAGDETGLLRDTCRLIIEHGEYTSAWTSLVSGDAHPTPLVAARADAPASPPAPDPEADALVRKALESRTLQILRPATHAEDTQGLHNSVAVPLLADGQRLLGVLCVVSSEAESFDADELDMLQELADDIAYGVQTLRTRALHAQTEASLRLREQAIEASINAIVISRADAEADNPVIYVNPGFERMTGYSADEIAGKNLRILLGNEPDQPGVERLRAAIRDGVDTRVTLRNYGKDGTLFWNEVALSAVRGADDRVTHFISVFNDCTERKRYEAELEQQATHDALTGLANRNLLDDRVHQAVLQARRSGTKIALMLLDLDRFKRINDGLGHAAGDLLLQEVAYRLSQVMRREDTVARLGGDEFVIVASSIGSADDAALLARKVLDAIAANVVVSGHSMSVTASLGIALFPRDGDDIANLLKHADLAMYRAKDRGRSTFQFFSPDLNTRVVERLTLENDLRCAPERGELELHYQPKVDLRHGHITGAEALIRWNHPVRGLLMPGTFVPLAEETGLIVAIGTWVIEAVCRQLEQWRRAGQPDINIAINVSARQFVDEQLSHTLARSLAAHGVEASLLHIEVTESAVMDDPERTIRILRGIKQLGVGISLDDFGTGYSNLTYVQRFPIDSLKIDRSFVEHINAPSGKAIPLMVISLGHSLGCKVIAEGVETPEQAQLLAAHDCDEMQGFLFSAALPADEFGRLLERGEKLLLPPSFT